MTVREVIVEINRAMMQLESINVSNYCMSKHWQVRINKAYDILYDLKHDLRSGK